MGDSVDNLSQILWCDHCSVDTRPLITSYVPHVHVKHPVYLVVEEGQVKLICNACWLLVTKIQIHDVIKSV